MHHANNKERPTTATAGRRNQAISYADLMKPDEDWRNLSHAAERRKIQNRLAQRAYRRNMRDRTKEVERLRKQLQKLEEEKEKTQVLTPPPEHVAIHGSHVLQRRESTLSLQSNSLDAPCHSPSIPAGSDWMNDCFQMWSSPGLPSDDAGLKCANFNMYPTHSTNCVSYCTTKHVSFIPTEPSVVPSIESCNAAKPQVLPHHTQRRASENPESYFTFCNAMDDLASFHSDPSCQSYPSSPNPDMGSMGHNNNNNNNGNVSWSPTCHETFHHVSCPASTYLPEMAAGERHHHHHHQQQQQQQQSLMHTVGGLPADSSRLVYRQLDMGDNLAAKLLGPPGTNRRVVALLMEYEADVNGYHEPTHMER